MYPSLLTSIDSTSHVHLVVGANSLAAARCAQSLEVGAIPRLIAPEHDGIENIAKYIDHTKVRWIKRDFKDDDLWLLGRDEIGGVVDAVFVTLGGQHPLSIHISSLCRRLRIPVNVTDAPHLCTFKLLSTHSDGPLQIGVTTSGRGCKLASRIRREIAAFLPANIGAAVERLGGLRRRLWEEDHATEKAQLEVEEDDSGQDAKFNSLVNTESPDDLKQRRIRWLSQVCEYWPLKRLAAVSDADIETLLQAYTPNTIDSNSDIHLEGSLKHRRKSGTIILAGSGPGHPALLTVATHHALQTASVVLADKLVPAPILSLIPRRTPVHIARKFPGNADAAQDELLSLGLAALHAGQTVVRLKQGDPFLFGRGAEEVAFFRSHGFRAHVVPGVTSALAAPALADIPPTHRGVADHVVLCTGTGRKGSAPEPPGYVPGRTATFLMALHRLPSLVGDLTGEKAGWPRETPCAVVERASCPDQRVIRTTLAHVCAAVEEQGSRPPGLLVVGRSCEVLERSEEKWVVKEGFRGLDWMEDEEADVLNMMGGVGYDGNREALRDSGKTD